MATCYVFADYLDEEHGLSLRLDQSGVADVPLAHHPLDALRAMQEDARTIVVLSTIHCTLHRVELPWLHDRKARAAIPYALEEHLVQNVDDLHFAFDKQYYQHNHYLVAVIDKQWLEKIIARLDALNIDFDTITLDWFALREHEACVTENTLIVHNDTFKGALSLELASLYLEHPPKNSAQFMFRDTAPALQNKAFTQVDDLSHAWIAERLFLKEGLNLCQGAFQHDTRLQANQFWYWASGILVGAWLIAWVLINSIHLHTLTKQIASLDQQIGVIYHQFYPKDKQVISPEFRIRQLLNTGSSGKDALFWPLLEKLSSAFDLQQLRIEQLRFQNRRLSITLTANDFAALEAFQVRLQQIGVKVAEAQATSRKKKVWATLELSL